MWWDCIKFEAGQFGGEDGGGWEGGGLKIVFQSLISVPVRVKRTELQQQQQKPIRPMKIDIMFLVSIFMGLGTM